MDADRLTRREFLSLLAAGVAVPWLRLPQPSRIGSAVQQGRVAEVTIRVFETASMKSQMKKIYWRDLLLPITNVTIGLDEPSYNRVWYRIGDEGYAYSGGIQPVEVNLNPTNRDIPPNGRLAEVTVPFTDAHSRPDHNADYAYRLYYGTTHWVTGYATDDQTVDWYKILDDKLKIEYYAPATHLHLVQPEEIAPLSPDFPAEMKRLEVSLADQTLTAYEGEKIVFNSKISSGARFSDGNYSTPIGRHTTYHTRPYRHMAAGDHAASNSFDLPGVPWICYFTESGISLHGTYWHNDFGRPRSHGCINLPIESAKWVYRWTTPVVGFDQEYQYKFTGTILDILG